MSAWDVLIACLALSLGIAGTVAATRRRRSPTEPAPSRAKILFPFEAIEHKAASVGVSVDGRIARGRNVRHAMRELIRDVPAATRIVVAGASNGDRDGFSVDDIAWLLRNAPGEVLVIRPDPTRPTNTPKDLQADPLLTRAHSRQQLAIK